MTGNNFTRKAYALLLLHVGIAVVCGRHEGLLDGAGQYPADKVELAAGRRNRILTVTGSIPGAVSGFISSVSDIMRKVITTPSSPLLGIVLAVFTLAFAGLWHDRRHRQDITTSVK